MSTSSIHNRHSCSTSTESQELTSHPNFGERRVDGINSPNQDRTNKIAVKILGVGLIAVGILCCFKPPLIPLGITSICFGITTLQYDDCQDCIEDPNWNTKPIEAPPYSREYDCSDSDND
ncbi:MAG: hypothetical protein K1000chlam3_00855 [Chlamydiae bacterium]|nr:hypothetical protein [Chlamydiota bacterium]